MNKYGEITLLKKTFEQDDIGQEIGEVEERKTIQCVIGSIGRNEWSTARQGGYEAEILATVFAASYDGESTALYNGKTFDIYRTYQDGDSTELYLGTKVGDIE
jgi:hypothetical protein